MVVVGVGGPAAVLSGDAVIDDGAVEGDAVGHPRDPMLLHG